MTRPLYIFSARAGETLAELARGGGWRVLTADRLDDAGRGLWESGAGVVVVDGRDDSDEALAWTAMLGRAALGRGLAILVLVPRDALARLDGLRTAGATHFLAAPFTDEEFVQALQFAAIGAERRLGPRAADGALTGDALIGFLARDLLRGLATGEIQVLFQPQVDIAGRAIMGVEALMRWRHRELGDVGPELLLEAADRAGLSIELSAHVHKRALKEAVAWPASLGHLRLSVNVTADDVAMDNFAAMLLARVNASGFPADRLTVEITERGLIADTDRATVVLNRLRSAGLRVAIDDFGTGYSSLAYLTQIPLDYLKLDQVLLRTIEHSQRDRVLLRGILQLAKSLELAVIAEGVERPEQRDLLAAEGCDFYQGFLCAGPLTVPELERLVAKRD